MSAQGGSHGSSISPMASSGTDSATTQLPSASLDPSLSDLQPVQSVLQLLPLYVKVAIERELGLAGNSLHVRRVTKCVSVQQQNGCQWLSTPYQRIEGQTRGCVWADLSHRKTHSRTSRPDSGSLLLLGPSGAGKTTLLRDITRQLADIFHKVVIVVDTSDEIAGGGRMAHECIGRARRMGATAHQSKYEVLEEAVANHGPEVVVIDEIGNAKEVAAVKDIAQRGVKMVATVHGTTLQHMLENPVLNPLVGGKQKMVIGDLAARSWNGRKTRSERCEAPTFSTIVEIRDRQNWYIHQDVAASVDDILNGSVPSTESR
ncbi:PFAM ATPase associated with various cellular activities (AAA) [Trebouxia sp. C0009 RCD-2024]